MRENNTVFPGDAALRRDEVTIGWPGDWRAIAAGVCRVSTGATRLLALHDHHSITTTTQLKL